MSYPTRCLALAALLFLTGCGGSSATTPTGTTDGTTDFTELVKTVFAQDEDAEPMSLEGLDIQGLDCPDPNAFDDLLDG